MAKNGDANGRVRRRTLVPLLVGALFAHASFSLDMTQLQNRSKVRDQLAAVPDLDHRLARLQIALTEARDQSSLSATTARYILEITKEAKATPEAFDFHMPAPGESPSQSATPSTKYANYVSAMVFTMDFGVELTRAEQLATEVRAGRDPLAGVKGDVHLAYRSNLDGMLMPYRIYVPETYEKSRKYPLIMLLHPAACDENTLMLGKLLQPIAEKRGYVIASINGRGPFSGFRKDNGAQKDLFDVLALMENYYSIDTNHVFLAGVSMGGIGTWNIGFEFRDQFAALAPMAGTVAMPEIDSKLASGKKIPILITAGGKDTDVPPEPATAVYEKLRVADYPAKLVVYPNDTHYEVFQSSVPEVFDWFDQYRK
jgi:dienelactone hydrolase